MGSKPEGLFALKDKNIDFVFRFLEIEGIEILSYDIGGTMHRKIIFNTGSFKIELKKTSPKDFIKNEENKYIKENEEKLKIQPDITFF